MENNELNNRVLKNVRNKIVISNLESEENMKINAKKQILSICAVALVMVSGGFFTVNAATNGQLAQDIKEFVTVTFTRADGTTEKVEGKPHTDANGDTWIKYEHKTENGESVLDINKNELDKENLEVDAKITENKSPEDEVNLEMNLEVKDRISNQ